MIMDSVAKAVKVVLEQRDNDLNMLVDGFGLYKSQIVREALNRGLDSMLTDLELSEGQR